MRKHARTRHPFFSMSGIIARGFIFASKSLPEPYDIVFAVGFGIVELLGAKRLYKILGPAVKAQLAEQFKVRRKI